MVYRNGEAIITTVQIQSVNLTWDEYQALPATKLTDGVYYNITDWEQSTLDIVNVLTGENIALQSRIAELENANTYSEEEVRIGIWVDMKPVYRKVYTIASFRNSTTISIPDIKEVTNLQLKRQYDSRANMWVYGAGVMSQNNLYFSYGTNSININTASSDTTIYNLTAIIEYTKTTD